MTRKEVMLLVLGLAESYFGAHKRSWRWILGQNFGQGSFDETRRNRDCFNRIVKSGWVARDGDDVSKIYLLDQGRKELLARFPLLELRKQDWDGKWRVVMYDLPEQIRTKRNKLREWLKRLGFAQWQLSVWVSPHPVISKLVEELEKVGLLDYCSVHESRRIVGVGDKEFADKIWGLTALNERYKKLESELVGKEMSRVIDVLMEDPLLPKALLPDDWRWEKLVELVARPF